MLRHCQYLFIYQYSFAFAPLSFPHSPLSIHQSLIILPIFSSPYLNPISHVYDSPSKLTPKNIKLCRPTLMNYIVTRDEFATYCDDLLALVDKHNISVNIYKVYPLKDAAQAHRVCCGPFISSFSSSSSFHSIIFFFLFVFVDLRSFVKLLSLCTHISRTFTLW